MPYLLNIKGNFKKGNTKVNMKPADSTAQSSYEFWPAVSEDSEHSDHQDAATGDAGTTEYPTGLSAPVDSDEGELLEPPSPAPPSPWASPVAYESDYFSPEEYRAFRTRRLWAMLLITLALLIAGIGTTFGIFLILSSKNQHPLVGSLIIAASCLIAIGVFIGGTLFIETKRPSRGSTVPGSQVRGRSQALGQAM